MKQKITKWKESDDNSSVVVKAKKNQKTIRELFKEYNGQTKLEEVDFGKSEGREVW